MSGVELAFGAAAFLGVVMPKLAIGALDALVVQPALTFLEAFALISLHIPFLPVVAFFGAKSAVPELGFVITGHTGNIIQAVSYTHLTLPTIYSV